VIASNSTPIVEIDTEATAAYVRYSRGKVAKTQPFGSRDSMVMVDFDTRGRVLGIEIVGIQEFSVSKLHKNAPVRLSKSTMNRALRHGGSGASVVWAQIEIIPWSSIRLQKYHGAGYRSGPSR